MIPIGLSAADQKAFEAGLLESHAIRITVETLDPDQNVMGVCRGRVLSGQVDTDRGGDVQRTLSLDILDPDNALNMDTGRPDAAGLFLDRMVRVHYGVRSPSLDRWVDVPVFTGPVDTFSRDGDTVSLTAQGKESLLQVPSCVNKTWKAGTLKTTVLRELLAAGGEAFFDIPDMSTKTTHDVTLAASEPIWPLVQSIARSWTPYRVDYDGRGYAKLYPAKASSRWTFKRGDGGSLASEPKLAYDVSSVKNHVTVTGGIPKGGKSPIIYTATPASSHPLSGESLGRNGVPRYFHDDVQADNITTKADAKALAEQHLSAGLQEGVSITFDSIPIPHLEPLDAVTIDAGSWVWGMQLGKFTLPLSSSGNMSIGQTYAVGTIRRPRHTTRKTPRKSAPRKVLNRR